MEPVLKKPKHKICSEDGCTKFVQKRGKCYRHGGRRFCNELGCTKYAQTKNYKCLTHAGLGLFCSEFGCTRLLRRKGEKCYEHRQTFCISFDCTNIALSGKNFCSVHRTRKRCIERGCEGFSIGKAGKCATHGGGRCSENGCNKRANGKIGKCVAHGGGIRCPNCVDWIDSRMGKKKYDNYCATCFKRVFPDDPRSKIIYEHTKEIRVRNFINKHFDKFIHDKPLYTNNCDCSLRRRIDHYKLINGTILAVETDEFGHKSYDVIDEKNRYDDLYMGHSGKYIYIRFNPDGKGVDMEDKLKILRECMEEQIRRIENDENEELVEIIKLFY